MSAFRAPALLVTPSSRDSSLVGIITDKDITYKVVAEGLDPASVAVSTVMTRDPISVTSDVSLDDALRIMASRHFRHLPVIKGKPRIS